MLSHCTIQAHPCSRQRGAALLLSLVVLVVLIALAGASMRDSQINERLVGKNRERAEAFQAAEAGLQAGVNAIVRSHRPPDSHKWGQNSIVKGCALADPNNAATCIAVEAAVSAWRSGTTPAHGAKMSAFGGAALWDSEASQPWIVIEARPLPINHEQFDTATSGLGMYLFSITSMARSQNGQAESVLQTTIPKIFN